jgi:hypothetical protein
VDRIVGVQAKAAIIKQVELELGGNSPFIVLDDGFRRDPRREICTGVGKITPPTLKEIVCRSGTVSAVAMMLQSQFVNDFLSRNGKLGTLELLSSERTMCSVSCLATRPFSK